MPIIIKKHNNRYLKKDGRNCVEPYNAMTFPTREFAEGFINSPQLGTAVYLSPQDHIDQVWLQWTIHELTITCHVSDPL